MEFLEGHVWHVATSSDLDGVLSIFREVVDRLPFYLDFLLLTKELGEVAEMVLCQVHPSLDHAFLTREVIKDLFIVWQAENLSHVRLCHVSVALCLINVFLKLRLECNVQSIMSHHKFKYNLTIT